MLDRFVRRRDGVTYDLATRARVKVGRRRDRPISAGAARSVEAAPALPAVDAVIEALCAAPPAGCAMQVAVAPRASRKLLVEHLAHHVSLRGFVPVTAAWCDAVRPGGVTSGDLERVLRHRDVLVLDEGRTPGAVRDAVLARFETRLRANGAARTSVLRLHAAAYPEGPSGAACVREHAGDDPGQSVALPVREAACTADSVARAERLTSQGRHTEAVRVLARACAQARRRRAWPRAGALMVVLATLARQRADTRAAERWARAARDAFDEAGSVAGVVAAMVHLAGAAEDDDRLEASEALLATARRAAGPLAEPDLVLVTDLALAQCAHWAGRADEARARLLEALGRGGTPHDAVAEASPRWGDSRPASMLLPPPGPEARVRLAEHRIAPASRVAAVAVAVGMAPSGVPAPWWAVCDTLAGHEADVLAFSAINRRTDAEAALAAGLRLARHRHRPMAALSLRLAYAECWKTHPSTDVSSLNAAALDRWRRRRLPGLFARRLAALADGRPPAAVAIRPAAATWSASDVVALVQACSEASDERAAVEHACEIARRRLDAAALSVFAADRSEPGRARPELLVNAGGRPCDGAEALAVAEAGGHPAAGEACAPLRTGGALIGVVTARWPVDRLEPPAAAGLYLAALASAIGPSAAALAAAAVPIPTASDATSEILGGSAAMVAVRSLVVKAAATTFPVLVLGESGTGKELAARAIHRASPRRARRFCAVNCAALTDELLEAELFGHTRGAFTGAAGDRAGLFEEADGGTLFLDEINELSPRAQAKLLRVLQEGEIRRLGENAPRRVDVRVVAATNRSLHDECRQGRFRRDLLYRLDVVRVEIPPLRERPEDLPLLVARFWRSACDQSGTRAVLTADALAALARHTWPGNVRELQNTLAALAVCGPPRGRIGPRDLPPEVAGARSARIAAGEWSLEAARRQFERRFVSEALARAGGRPGRAAQALGLTRQGLAKMLARLGLERGVEHAAT